MTDKALVLRLDDELAAAYEKVAQIEGEHEKVELVMNLLLRQLLLPQNRRRTLMEIMDAISDQAEANGLTDEVLNEDVKGSRG
jgi:hypothetical protein